MKILMVLIVGMAGLVFGTPTSAQINIHVPGVRIETPYVFSRGPCRGCDYGRYHGRVGWHRGHKHRDFHPMRYRGRYGYTNRHDYEHGRR